ncbi:MAG: hypothetical protein KAW12_01130 [Candidatus Aminicenantes bacterium]|nr:hypothetical protein [Candidatus Aminicenantes bacterium]
MRNKKKIIVFAVVFSFLFVNFAFSAVAVPQAKETTKKIKAETDKEPTVYIKAKGKKYHKKNCRLVKDKKGVKLSEAVKLGYDPCQVCKPPALDPKVVKKLRKDIKKDPKEK